MIFQGDLNDFEVHVRDRHLSIAKTLADHFESNTDGDSLSLSGFVILHIVFSYFEMISQFKKGESSQNKSEIFFIDGFKDVFGQATLNSIDLKCLYRSVRCGMYHNGLPKVNIAVTREQYVAIAIKKGELVINPRLFTNSVVDHFGRYMAALRLGTDAELEAKFKTMFKRQTHVFTSSGSPMPPGTTSSTTQQTNLLS